MVFVYALIAVLVLAILYTDYKLIWYAIKMTVLHGRLAALKKRGVTVRYKPSFVKAVFQRKCGVSFTLTSGEGTFEVILLTFVSTHGRWNIEKVVDKYFAEARHNNFVFYGLGKSSEQPDVALDYSNKETRLSRKELLLEGEDPEAQRILLICPRPKLLSKAENTFEFLGSGSTVNGFEVMYEKDFFERFAGKE